MTGSVKRAPTYHITCLYTYHTSCHLKGFVYGDPSWISLNRSTTNISTLVVAPSVALLVLCAFVEIPLLLHATSINLFIPQNL